MEERDTNAGAAPPTPGPVPYASEPEDLLVLARYWARELVDQEGFWFLTGSLDSRRRRAWALERLADLAGALGAADVNAAVVGAREEEARRLGPILGGIFLRGTEDEVGRVPDHFMAVVEAGPPRPVMLLGDGWHAEVGEDLTMTVVGALRVLEVPGAAWRAALGLAEAGGWVPAGTLHPEAPWAWGRWDYSSPRGQRVTAADALALADGLEAEVRRGGEPGRFADVIAACRGWGGFVVGGDRPPGPEGDDASAPPEPEEGEDWHAPMEPGEEDVTQGSGEDEG